MRFRFAIATAVALLLMFPAAILAQTDTARQIVELIFSDDKSKITVSETVRSSARVTFTHDGNDYQVDVPVTISIDETVQIADASSTTAAARVGVFALEVTGIGESIEAVEVGYRTVEPSSDTNKLIGVWFNLTNLSDVAQEFKSWFSDEAVYGMDATGRQFEVEQVLLCDEVNPGGTVECLAVFDVEKSITLTKIEVRAIDTRVFDLPEVGE